MGGFSEAGRQIMAIEWISGTVVARRLWAPGLFSLWIRADGVEPFEPGQFLQVGLALPDRHLHRPYSVASPWGTVLEFLVTLVPEGALTPRLFAMRVGDTVDISRRAAGGFTLQQTPPAPHLWLIATGTGLAPYLAMLHRPDVWDRHRRVVLVHGVRHRSELAHAETLIDWQRSQGDRFSYVPVVSRQQPRIGLAGRVTDALVSGQLERLAQTQLDPHSTAVMLCGNPAMLDDMQQLLGQRGLVPHRRNQPGHIVAERYW
jgi:ferredoxin/flavodoxin---NADP+ reductase